MASGGLSLLLADYQERNNDYRRQVAYYGKIITTVILILAGAVGWVLASPSSKDRPYHLLPLAVGMANVALLMTLFVFRSSQLMRTYLVALEKALNDWALLGAGQQPIHRVDGDAKPSLFTGYHTWKSGCRDLPAARAARRLVRVIVLLTVATLEMALVVWGLRDTWYPGSVAKGAVVAILLVGPVAGGLLAYRALRAGCAEELNAVLQLKTSSWGPRPVDEDDVRSILLTDLTERSEDFRFWADYYHHVFLWAFGGITALVSLWVADRSQEWVFLLVPPVLLCAAFVDVLVFRRVQRVKLYIEEVERLADRWAETDGWPCVHLSGGRRRVDEANKDGEAGLFRIGFFRFVRKQGIEDTESGRVPGYAVLLTMIITGILLVFTWTAITNGAKWMVDMLGAERGRYMWAVYWGAVAVLTFLVVGMFVSSRKISVHHVSTAE